MRLGNPLKKKEVKKEAKQEQPQIKKVEKKHIPLQASLPVPQETQGKRQVKFSDRLPRKVWNQKKRARKQARKSYKFNCSRGR